MFERFLSPNEGSELFSKMRKVVDGEIQAPLSDSDEQKFMSDAKKDAMEKKIEKLSHPKPKLRPASFHDWQAASEKRDDERWHNAA
jgi:hypothetical protein